MKPGDTVWLKSGEQFELFGRIAGGQHQHWRVRDAKGDLYIFPLGLLYRMPPKPKPAESMGGLFET